MRTDGVNMTDETPETGEASGLKEYTVNINGFETTLQLSDEDAKRLGVHADSPQGKAASASNKARGASNK